MSQPGTMFGSEVTLLAGAADQSAGDHGELAAPHTGAEQYQLRVPGQLRNRAVLRTLDAHGGVAVLKLALEGRHRGGVGLVVRVRPLGDHVLSMKRPASQRAHSPELSR